MAKTVAEIEQEQKEEWERLKALSRLTEAEEEKLYELVKEKVLEILRSRTDEFRWVYSPCRGHSQVFKRDELIKEIEEGTLVGNEYIASVVRLALDF